MSYPQMYASKRAPRRGAAAGQASRAKALRAATKLFGTRGFHTTTIADIAQEAGLSQSGLLHHFSSKAALLSAVLEERDTEDSEFLSGDQATPLSWAAFDALTALVARNSTRPELIGLFVRLSAEATDPHHPAHSWLQDRYANTRAWLTDAVRTVQRAGEMHPDAPVDDIVRTTIAVIDGLQQQWLVEPQTMSMVGSFSTYLAALRGQWATTPITNL